MNNCVIIIWLLVLVGNVVQSVEYDDSSPYDRAGKRDDAITLKDITGKWKRYFVENTVLPGDDSMLDGHDVDDHEGDDGTPNEELPDHENEQDDRMPTKSKNRLETNEITLLSAGCAIVGAIIFGILVNIAKNYWNQWSAPLPTEGRSIPILEPHFTMIVKDFESDVVLAVAIEVEL